MVGSWIWKNQTRLAHSDNELTWRRTTESVSGMTRKRLTQTLPFRVIPDADRHHRNKGRLERQGGESPRRASS